MRLQLRLLCAQVQRAVPLGFPTGGTPPPPPPSSSSQPQSPSISTASGTTGSFTVKWNDPQFNADGSAVGSITGYRVYYGTNRGKQSEGTAGAASDVAAGTRQLTASVAAGTYYVAVRCTTANGNSYVSGEKKVVVS